MKLIFLERFSLLHCVCVCVCENEWWRGERRKKMSEGGLQDKDNEHFSCISLNTHERCKEEYRTIYIYICVCGFFFFFASPKQYAVS